MDKLTKEKPLAQEVTELQTGQTGRTPQEELPPKACSTSHAPSPSSHHHALLEGGYWNTWTFSLTQFRPSYVPMTINNKSQAICCCTRKGWRPPRTQTLQLSYLQLKGGESLLCDCRISGQALSYTASCKTARAAATQHAASISSWAVERRLAKVKLTSFPAFLWTYVRGQQSPEKLTTQLPRWEGKQRWFPGRGGGQSLKHAHLLPLCYLLLCHNFPPCRRSGTWTPSLLQTRHHHICLEGASETSSLCLHQMDSSDQLKPSVQHPKGRNRNRGKNHR